jgi:AcrR family transcriptional regulator
MPAADAEPDPETATPRLRPVVDAGPNAGASAPTKRVRMDAADRRLALLEVAEDAFAELGYQQASLAEIAKRARVSKTLLYHYYPEGRPELYGEVQRRLADELLRRCRQATGAPLAADQRLGELVDAVFGFFADHPGAFRVLLVEPWTAGDPAILGLAISVRLELVREITTLCATTEAELATVEGAAVAAVGSLIQECELWMSESITRATATEVTVAYLRGGLRELRLL